MKALLIDDNPFLLSLLENLGYKTISSVGKEIQEVISEAVTKFTKSADVFINISLLYDRSNNRMAYAGITLMEKLMFEIPVKQWNLLSFEKRENILKKHNTQILSKLQNVKIIDYITFLKEVAKNAEQ